MTNLPLENKSVAQMQQVSPSMLKQSMSCVMSACLMVTMLLVDAFGPVHLISVQFVLLLLIMYGPAIHRIMFVTASLSMAAAIMAVMSEQALFEKPLLSSQTQIPINAKILKIEHQTKDRMRIWVSDVLDIEEMAEFHKDDIIRLVIDQKPDVAIVPGDRMSGRVILYPLSVPLFTSWPDYARKSWREGIVATGYGRGIRIIKTDSPTKQPVITRLRSAISRDIDEQIAGPSALLAKALLIGERNFSQKTFYEVFRKAGLAHLLAISGLHMGLFCFGVYGLLCSFMALPLQISQRWPHHKIAAIIAIASGLFYLLLAGTPISAIRAFAMAGLILCAALWDRRTVTLRNLNYVFVLFLIMMPSALYQPAFQLSFAATYGIVCFHIYVKSSGIFKEHIWGRRVFYLTATSFIAIIATAPITIYHFGALSVWGVLSNMVAIPFTAIVIMPLCVMYLTAFSAGLSEIIAPLLTFALSGLIWFAKMMASLPYSLVPVKPIPPVYLPLFGLCGIALYLANRRGRFVAGTIIVFFVLVWSAQNRPVGALYWQDRYVRFAFLDGRVLHHTGRLTNFWHDNYEKLLGPFDNTKQHKCRDICRISTPSYDVTINLQAPSLLICLTGISGETNCQPMVLPQSGYHMKLFYNNALGHYIEARKKPVRPKIWHGD